MPHLPAFKSRDRDGDFVCYIVAREGFDRDFDILASIFRNHGFSSGFDLGLRSLRADFDIDSDGAFVRRSIFSQHDECFGWAVNRGVVSASDSQRGDRDHNSLENSLPSHHIFIVKPAGRRVNLRNLEPG